jgi:hypothetical protein
LHFAINAASNRRGKQHDPIPLLGLLHPAAFPGTKPEMLNEVFYTPTLSHELGWVESMRRKDQPGFVSTEELADACVTQYDQVFDARSRSGLLRV